MSVSAWVRTDPQHPATVEHCRPNGILDLALSDDEQQKTVDDALRSCENPTFPPGYAKAAPAAALSTDQPPAGTSSCAAAAAPSRRRESAAVAMIAVGLLAATVRRRRGALVSTRNDQ